MADLEQSVGEINVTSVHGFAYAFVIDYPATEGDFTADVFEAHIDVSDGTQVPLLAVATYSTFTRITVSLSAENAALIQRGSNLWGLVRTTNGVPAPEFSGTWSIK